jgi:hypothetical protein
VDNPTIFVGDEYNLRRVGPTISYEFARNGNRLLAGSLIIGKLLAVGIAKVPLQVAHMKKVLRHN